MEKKWYDELGEDAFLSEENKRYKEMMGEITGAVKNGMGFDEACDTVDIEDAELKTSIIEDALKILIADMHFMQKMSTGRVAEILKIPVKRVNSARESMLEEVKAASIKAFHKSI